MSFLHAHATLAFLLVQVFAQNTRSSLADHIMGSSNQIPIFAVQSVKDLSHSIDEKTPPLSPI